MKKLLVLMFFSTFVWADLPFQPHFTWTGPTEFTDGSPLDPAIDLSEYRLNCTGADSVNIIVSNTLIDFEPPLGVFVAGDYVCTMAAVDNAGGISADSAPVNFTVSQKVPRPIVNFGVI